MFEFICRDKSGDDSLKEHIHRLGVSAQQKPKVLAYLRDTEPVVVPQITSDKHNRRHALGVEGPVFELESCATRFERTQSRTITQYLGHKRLM